MTPAIRPAVLGPDDGTDNGFVYRAWLSTWVASHASGPYRRNEVLDITRAHVDFLLARPKVQVAIAFNEKYKDVFYGFVAWEPPGAHEHHRQKCGAPSLLYVYVKEADRRQGYANALLRHAGIEPTKPFCYAFRPARPGRDVFASSWTGGRCDPFTYTYPEQEARS